MRDWQKSIETTTTTNEVPIEKTEYSEKNLNIFLWTISTFIFIFCTLFFLKPSFIENQDKEKLFEKKKISWISLILFSFAAATLVFLISVQFEK